MRLALLLAITLAAPAPSHAGPLSQLGGHLALGYAKLFATDAPGGSFSVGAGLDLPVVEGLRVGADVNYHLLGTRTVERGSFFASVDYSVFEADLLAHWTPAFGGPLAQVSAGPGVVAAHADLSTAAGGGAAFSDLAVQEAAPAASLGLTFMPRAGMPVKIGIETDARVAWLKHETWTIADLRLTAHY